MEIKLYTNTSPAESLTKTLSIVKVIPNAVLYQPSDVLSLTIKIDRKTTANYASVEGYGLYFISNQISQSGSCLLVLTKDCLTSNRNEILATNQLISRSAVNYNHMIPDSIQPLESRKYVIAKQYSTPLAKNDSGHNFLIGVIS